MLQMNIAMGLCSGTVRKKVFQRTQSGSAWIYYPDIRMNQLCELQRKSLRLAGKTYWQSNRLVPEYKFRASLGKIWLSEGDSEGREIWLYFTNKDRTEEWMSSVTTSSKPNSIPHKSGSWGTKGSTESHSAEFIYL
jgi:hypothetical protein